MTQVLEGITVLDFTQGMAGSIATMVMSDFGAEVIKIEPSDGDPFRSFPAALLWNRGKKSVVLDMAEEDGRRKVQDLAQRADVVIEGFRPGTAEKLGIGYDALSANRPDLVYCSITGFGPVGPYARYKGYDGLVAAKCGRLMGFAGLTGREGPSYAVVNVASHAAAMAAVRGTVAALLVRDTTGQGQRVETSLLQAIAYYDIDHWIVGQMMKKFPEDFPSYPYAAGRPPSLPYMATRTADGQWIQLANVIQRLFVAEIRAIGLGHIFDDPRFASAPRLGDDEREELRRMILRRMQEKTLDEWMDLFVNSEGDVAAEPFMTSVEALGHPQILHNGMVQKVEDPAVGPMRQLGVLAQMDASPASIKGPAPLLGQHTEEVLDQLARDAGSSSGQPTPGSSRIPTDPTRSGAAAGGPLAGVTVLDMSAVIAGPLSASLVGELGARVIRIETIQGDLMRQNLMGLSTNRTMAGTEGLSVDLKTDEGQAILGKLIPMADILVHNMRPGAPERVGIGLERVRELNPDITYVYVGGYGSTGPHNRRPAMHPIGGAVSGGALTQAGGREGLPPADASMTMEEIVEVSRKLGRAQDVNPDPNTSMVSATAMVLALYARHRLGKPQYVEVSMIGANAYANADDFFDYEGKPDRAVPDTDGFGLGALYRIYEAADGWVFLACPLESEWRALCDALGPPDLADDPRFASAPARHENDAALAARLAAVFAAEPAAQWEKRLSAADVGCVKVEDRNVFDFFDKDDHVRQNGFTTEVEHVRLGSFWRHSPVLGFSKTPGKVGSGILRGQHTMPIMKELGYSEAEVHALKAKGVLDWEEP